MAEERQIIKTIFKLRRGDSDLWHSLNPLLEDGEPGFELDTNLLKIGNGIDLYNDLPYINNQLIPVDNKSLDIQDGMIEIAGFSYATDGQILVKENDEIVWKDLSTMIEPISDEEILNICI